MSDPGGHWGDFLAELGDEEASDPHEEAPQVFSKDTVQCQLQQK